MPTPRTISFRPLAVTDALIVAILIDQCRDYFLLVEGQLPSLPEIHHALTEDCPAGKQNEFWFWGMFNESGQLLGTI